MIIYTINIITFYYYNVVDDSNRTKNIRKRSSSDSFPTLDPNSCNGSKKSKLESKAISALVAYGSDSSEDEDENEESQKSTILQRLQHKAEMFKQKELNKLTKDESPNLTINGQPDILDIIGEEVPPDYVIEQPNVLQSSEKISGDIFGIIKNEVPPDYVDDTTNNNTDKDNKSIVLADSKTSVKLQSKVVDNDSKTKNYTNTDEKLKNTSSDSFKENSFHLIAIYGDEDQNDTGINDLFSFFFNFN